MNSIEGNWIGEYKYGKNCSEEFRGRLVKFSAQILFDGDIIKGTCVDEETREIFDTPSTLDGTYEDGKILFYKTYPDDSKVVGDKLKAQEYNKTGSIQYIGTLKKRFFSKTYYFEGIWDIHVSLLNEKGGSQHYSVDGTWKMHRAK